jgi:hypothetical protein
VFVDGTPTRSCHSALAYTSLPTLADLSIRFLRTMCYNRGVLLFLPLFLVTSLVFKEFF